MDAAVDDDFDECFAVKLSKLVKPLYNVAPNSLCVPRAGLGHLIDVKNSRAIEMPRNASWAM